MANAGFRRPHRRAAVDPRLTARVVGRRPLLHTAGADPTLDRPAHVRAASSIARSVGGVLLVVQDDASFLAWIDPKGYEKSGSTAVEAQPLPAGPSGARQFDDLRGNKADKLDLEACATLYLDASDPSSLVHVVFGSGSSPKRERIVLVRPVPGELRSSWRVCDASSFYARLRSMEEFAGSELNVEGACSIDGDILLFQRGNGAPRGELGPVDATCRVDARALLDHLEDPSAPVPEVRDVETFELGSIAGTRLTFTDAALVPFGARQRVLYLAAAEASPDATRDGPVSGVAIGLLESEPRHALVVAEDGALLTDKVEGLVRGEIEGRVFAVVDKDDPTIPADLLEIELVGAW